MKRLSLGLIAAVAMLSGCGDRPVFGLARDAGVDARTLDAGTMADAAPDAGRDANLDAAMMLDVGLPDGGTDAGRDAGMDAGMDASADAGRDAATSDAPGDAGRDAATSDAARDAGRDAGTSDAAGDAAGRRGPPPVILGSRTDLTAPGAYVLIGKTGISNVVGSMISGGHLGVSPSGSTAITGFALILDSSGEFSSSVAVVPPARVYASDYSAPTPSNLTQAILGMEGAYTDAATRTDAAIVNTAGGLLGGLTLAPGLYTFDTSVNIATALTLDGGANDVWIFTITNDLNLAAATSIILAGGASAENIFWQVAGQTTLGATSHFEGIILCQTGITLQTGASLHGRALAQSMIALDNNNITAP